MKLLPLAWSAGESASAAPNRYEPAGPAVVPAMVAVPLALLVNVTPDGSAPLNDSAGVGDPVVVTVKVPGAPAVKLVVAALVNTGRCRIVIANVCVAAETPLNALTSREYVPADPRRRSAGERGRAVAVVGQG